MAARASGAWVTPTDGEGRVADGPNREPPGPLPDIRAGGQQQHDQDQLEPAKQFHSIPFLSNLFAAEYGIRDRTGIIQVRLAT